MTSSSFSLESKKKMVYVNADTILFYHRGSFYLMENGTLIKKIAAYPSFIYRFFTKIRLFERIFRLEPREVFKDGDFFFFASKKHIFAFSRDVPVHSIFVFTDGTNAPLHFSFMDNPAAPFFHYYLFGSYHENKKRDVINAYALKDLSVILIGQFPKATVKHIHNFFFDNISGNLFVLTGDDDFESGLWTYNETERSFEPYLVGKQQFRSCFCFSEFAYHYWVSDSPITDNFLYSEKEKKVSPLFPVNGPAINGKLGPDGTFYFLTSVEPSSFLQGFSYLLTQKCGEGIKSKRVCVYAFRQGQLSLLATFDKDLFPMGLCQFGNGNLFIDKGRLYCTLVAVKTFDGCTLEMRTH